MPRAVTALPLALVLPGRNQSRNFNRLVVLASGPGWPRSNYRDPSRSPPSLVIRPEVAEGAEGLTFCIGRRRRVPWYARVRDAAMFH